MKKQIDSLKKSITKKPKKKEKSSILAKLEKKTSKALKLTKKQLLISGSIATAIVIFIIFCAISHYALAQTIYPNIWIGDVNLGNKSTKAAEDLLNQKFKTYFNNTVLTLTSKENNYQLKPQEIEVGINMTKTTQSLYDIGHRQNFVSAGFTRIRLIFKPIHLAAKIDIDQNKWNKFVEQISTDADVSFQNAGLKFENGQIAEIPSSIGLRLEEPILRYQVKKNIGNFQNNQISLPLVLAFPQIERGDTLLAQEEARKIMSDALLIVYKDKKFTVSPESIGSWINFIQKPKSQVLEVKSENDPVSYFISQADYTLVAQLDESKIKQYIDEIAGQVDIAPKNATLTFSSGKLKISSPSITGRAIDRDKLYFDIQTALKSNSYRKVTIKITTTSPEVNEDNYLTLGISELISEGTSSFSGSPRNRIHNIKTGASRFNGVLIKPGETFSFDTNLGPVGPQTGYLPELVIKENKTIPEYGGGLCQVSTTTFRAALLAGLPIIERKEHAYRVKYYDWPYGPGVDATVYQPSPDMKFKNDTSGWILIQTRTSGNQLIFSFYGKKSGKYGVINKPRVLWSNPDGSMGTEFTRDIFQNGQLIKTDTFRSRYKSAALFPKPAVETGAPTATPAENAPPAE